MDGDLLRHCPATVVYRGGKVLRDVPRDFGTFALDPNDEDAFRTPAQILAHMCDLYDWAWCLARGEYVWKNTPPGTWADDVARFNAGEVKPFKGFVNEDGVAELRRGRSRQHKQPPRRDYCGSERHVTGID